MANRYNIVKKEKESISIINFDAIEGYKIEPKNKINYDGIVVNKMVVVNNSLIEKLIKRKIKNKLEKYLILIMQEVEEDSDSDSTLNEILDDLKRYKSIIKNKYKKYLEEKYLIALNKKIEIIEYEIKKRILQLKIAHEYTDIDEPERKRRR